jgi:hypothetical protein
MFYSLPLWTTVQSDLADHMDHHPAAALRPCAPASGPASAPGPPRDSRRSSPHLLSQGLIAAQRAGLHRAHDAEIRRIPPWGSLAGWDRGGTQTTRRTAPPRHLVLSRRQGMQPSSVC